MSSGMDQALLKRSEPLATVGTHCFPCHGLRTLRTVLDYASVFFNAVGAMVIIHGGGRAVFYTVQREILRRKVSYNQVRFDLIQMLVQVSSS